jgi:hypothetical protein
MIISSKYRKGKRSWRRLVQPGGAYLALGLLHTSVCRERVHCISLRLDGDLFHSDNEEFFSSLSAPYELQKVRTAAVKIAKFYDFQAEYEGSIPFTRSINAALPSFLAALLVAWPRVSRRVISFFTLATSIMHRGNFCFARGERHA